MSKKIMLSGAALIAAAAAMVSPVAASAQRYGYNGNGYDAPRYEQSYNGGYDQRGYGQRGYDQRGYDQRGYDQRGYDQRGYDQRGYDRSAYRDTRCNSGTGGTLIGAIAGGLLGRTIDTRGDRTLGTVLGAGAGALAGNAIGRSGNPQYCRR